MDNKTKPRSRKDDVVLQEIDGEVLIYDLKVDKAFCLNKTSALVWQACDGKRTIAEINDVVGKQLNANVNEDVIWLALEQLSKEKLIDEKISAPAKFNGLSRREAIKKAGLGAMIALPVVASLVAPMAIHAASSCVLMVSGCVCSGTNPMNGLQDLCTALPGPPTCASDCRCFWNNNGNNTGDCKP